MAHQISVRRVLVLAAEPVEPRILREAVARDGRTTEAFVVAPALNSRLRHWTSDEDGARARAESRLADCLAALAEARVSARGWVGDADALQAIADALPVFPADELVLVTAPEQRSNWLARDLAGRARDRFALPIAELRAEHASGRPRLAVAA